MIGRNVVPTWPPRTNDAPDWRPMSYDVELRGITMARLAHISKGHPFYTGDESRLTYENPATQTTWTVEPGPEAPIVKLALPRGSWCGHEAAMELAGMAAALKQPLWSRTDRVELEGYEPVRRAIWEANAVARRTIAAAGDTTFFHARGVQGSHWWKWQAYLASHMKGLGAGGHVPPMLWLVDLDSQRAALLFLWAYGQAQAFPPADAVLLHAPGGDDLVVPYSVVMETLGDLVTTHEFSDGVRTPLVPVERDAECRERWRTTFGPGVRFPSMAEANMRLGFPAEILDDLEP